MTQTNISREAVELGPCPFCGGIEWNVINRGTTCLVVHVQREKATRYQVMCRNKKCDVKPKTSIHITREDAYRAWNTRAQSTRIAELEAEMDKYKKLYEDARMSEWRR